jgi:hypothetical protein
VRSPISKISKCISATFFGSHFHKPSVCPQYCGSADYYCICPPLYMHTVCTVQAAQVVVGPATVLPPAPLEPLPAAPVDAVEVGH